MIKPFVDIQERLVARVVALKYVDEDWGQLDYENPPVKYPCALVDCEDIAVSQAGGRLMLDKVSIVVRIADMRLSNSSQAAPTAQKTANYAVFNILSQVIAALHGWTGSPDDYGRLQRVAQRRIRRTDGVRVYEIVFECMLFNRVAMKSLVEVNAEPQVNPEINTI